MAAEGVVNDAPQLNLRRELFVNTACHFIGVLSPHSKHLLTLPRTERTGGAFSDLLAEMENMKFFKMFSNRTKESLAATLQYVTRPADASLLAQGEKDAPLQALYVLLSGVVAERYGPPAVDSDSPTFWPEKILRKGEFFGHVDIVHGRPPTVDARTVGYSELLMLPKSDFDTVRKEMETHTGRAAHYLRITEAIGRFEWTEEERRVLEIYSKLCTYPKDHEIYGGVDNSDRPFWSFFVVSGVCKIAREVTYISDSGHLKNVPFQLRKELKTDKMVSERVQFEEVEQGYYFGVGESFGGNYVIARSTVECLLLPRLLLVFKNKELLREMAKALSDSLPSDQEVLDSYSNLVRASQKQVEMFRDLFKRKPERLIKRQSESAK